MSNLKNIAYDLTMMENMPEVNGAYFKPIAQLSDDEDSAHNIAPHNGYLCTINKDVLETFETSGPHFIPILNRQDEAIIDRLHSLRMPLGGKYAKNTCMVLTSSCICKMTDGSKVLGGFFKPYGARWKDGLKYLTSDQACIELIGDFTQLKTITPSYEINDLHALIIRE